jgi:hypothetical protein
MAEKGAAADSAALISKGVERTLELAATWLVWDGRPRLADDDERIYTPHKAIRRHVDHLIDHLAHIEAILSGNSTIADGWHGSRVTVSSDLAPFMEADLNEARQRLTRLAQIYAVRLGSLPAAAWDAPHEGDWTVRQIVEHVGPAWYAEQVGDLRSRPQ